MGNPSLIAKLGIDEADFARGLKASEAGLAQTQEKAKLLAAQIALLEHEMAGGKTDALVQQHGKLQSALRETQAEAKAAAKQLAALEAVKPTSGGGADESARYQAHLRSADEQIRSQRAREAIENTRLPMPVASGPQATIIRGYPAPEAEGAGGGHGGSNTMRNAELMHSGRAMADMLAAGMSPLQALMMEAPRLFQAFASSLGAILLPIGALVGGGMFVKWLHDAETEAKALRAETAAIGSNLGSLAGANAQELQKTLAETAAQAAKVREAYDSKSNWFVNHLTGGGVHEEDVQAAKAQQERVQDRMQGAQERDAGFSRRGFEGDAGVEADRIRVEYAHKRDEIVKQASADDIEGATRALAIAQQERDLQLDTLARKQALQQNELALETQLLSIRRYGKDVAVENARARMEKAKADLDAGPQEGPEHEANLRRYQGAQTDHAEAGQQQKESDAALDLRTRNASLRGSADDVAYQQATNNRDAIQGKLDDPATKADEAKKLRADLAEAQARLAALGKASNEKGIEIQKLGIKAETGRGPQAQIDAADKSLQLIEQQRKHNQEKNGDDPLVNARLNDEAAELLKRKQEILFTERQSLETLERQGEQIRNHGMELDATAKKAQIDDKYRPEIEKAEHDNDPAKAAALQKNEAGEQFNADVDEEMMTPQQKAERTRKNLARSQAAARVETRQRRHGEIEAANHPSLPNRRITAPNRIDAIKAGAANAGKGDKPMSDSNIVKGLDRVVKAVEKISTKNRK